MHADQAQRMPLFIHAMSGPFAVHGQPIELPGEPDGEIGDVDHLLNFAAPLRQNLTGFERNQHAEVVFRGAQFVPNLPHQFAALRSRQVPPPRRGLLGEVHRVVVVFLHPEPHGGQQLPIRRADDLYLIATRVGPLGVADAGLLSGDAQPVQQPPYMGLVHRRI